MKIHYPIRLVLAAQPDATADAVRVALASSGEALRWCVAPDPEALSRVAVDPAWELALVPVGASDVARVAEICRVLGEGEGIGVVAVVDGPVSGSFAAELGAAGACDAVSLEWNGRLHQVVAREVGVRRLRRELDRAGADRRGSGETLHRLLALCPQPAALARRGVVRDASPALGAAIGGATEVVGGALWDWVSEADRGPLRQLIEEGWRAEDEPLDVDLSTAGGTPVRLRFEAAGLADGPGHLVTVLQPDAPGYRRPDDPGGPALPRSTPISEPARRPAGRVPPARVVSLAPEARAAPAPVVPEPAPPARPRAAPRPRSEGGPSDQPGTPTVASEPPPTAAVPAAPVVASEPAPSAAVPAAPIVASEPPPTAVAPAASGTPLPDRAGLLTALAAASASDEPGISCLYYIGVDNHAALREQLGIDGLETVFDGVAEKVRAALPAGVLLTRPADDGLGVVATGRTREQALALRDGLESAVAASLVEHAGRTVLVACSLGLAGVRRGDDAAAILQRAYEASCSELETDAGEEGDAAVLDSVAESSIEELAADLTAAMSDGRVHLVFQPIVRLQGESVEFFETFLRRRDGDGVSQRPAEFLDTADRAGMRDEVDRWIFNRAIDILADAVRNGRGTRLLVKISPACIGDIDIPLLIGRRLKEERIPHGRLVVETTERAASTQVKATRAFMHAVRGFGCGTAIEHFGVSRSPFRLLEHVPADYLVIDRSIVNHVADKPAYLERVREIVAKARDLGKHTIAEYLDDVRSVSLLYQTGIEFVQGEHIQPPSESLDYQFDLAAG